MKFWSFPCSLLVATLLRRPEKRSFKDHRNCYPWQGYHLICDKFQRQSIISKIIKLLFSWLRKLDFMGTNLNTLDLQKGYIFHQVWMTSFLRNYLTTYVYCQSRRGTLSVTFPLKKHWSKLWALYGQWVTLSYLKVW